MAAGEAQSRRQAARHGNGRQNPQRQERNVPERRSPDQPVPLMDRRPMAKTASPSSPERLALADANQRLTDATRALADAENARSQALTAWSEERACVIAATRASESCGGN